MLSRINITDNSVPQVAVFYTYNNYSVCDATVLGFQVKIKQTKHMIHD